MIGKAYGRGLPGTRPTESNYLARLGHRDLIDYLNHAAEDFSPDMHGTYQKVTDKDLQNLFSSKSICTSFGNTDRIFLSPVHNLSSGRMH